MKKIGFECKMFRGPAGEKPTTEVKEVTSVTVTFEKSQIDLTSRSSAGWKVYKGGLKDLGVEFSLFYDPEDENFKAFQASYFDGTPLAVFIADDEGNGVDGDFEVMNFSQPQELEESVKVSVTLKPTMAGQDGRVPAWVVASKDA